MYDRSFSMINRNRCRGKEEVGLEQSKSQGWV